MGQGTESSETCAADRPTEVSVIRFVSSRNRIEEIAPKKEVYICKQQGCGKIFTNQDDCKSHELLELLKVRFICREPECGEELPDPGSMWRHYLEWHNNETSAFICPYTKCGSEHASSEILADHIESSHRRLPKIPTEPEIICFEGSDNVMSGEISTAGADGNNFDNVGSNTQEVINNGVVKKNEFSKRNEVVNMKQGTYDMKGKKKIIHIKKENFCMEQSKLRAALTHDDYSKNRELNRATAKFQNNKNVIVIKENYYDSPSSVCSSDSVQVDSSQDSNNTIYISSDVSLTKHPTQEHRIELGNLEKAFRNELERDSTPSKPEENTIETKSNCSDDEEYTPKKQRMSRNKQESYKCDINNCGKTYKYVSHFRHHQDSHKSINSTVSINSIKPSKPKPGKNTTIYICKAPSCGIEMNNVNMLWKHYHETHANQKTSTCITKNAEIYRCKILGCEMEFTSSAMLCKHFNDIHPKTSVNVTSINLKTVNGNGVLVEQIFADDSTTQQANLKTDLKTKHSIKVNEYTDNKDKNIQSVIKNESSD